MAARLTAYLVVFIVGATFIAGLIVGAQRDDDGPVDLIVHNAVVFTGEKNARLAEAVAVRANQVLKVGSNREILKLQRPQTVMVDARGGAVLPGFNDAHLHLIEGGLQLSGVDLAGAETVAEAIARVQAWSEQNPDAAWVTGHGWTPFPDDSAQPTRQALDAVGGGRPVYLLSADGKTAWVSSRALKLAKVARRSADPADGHIVKDKRGEPSGVLEGSATQLIATLLPKPTRDERMRALLAALVDAQRQGITSIQAAVDDADDLQLFETAVRGGATDMRVYPVLEFDTPRTDAEIAKLDPILAQYADDPFLKSGAIEVELEGVEADPLNRLVRLLDERGWQISIEADDEQEAEMARAAFAHAVRSNASVVRARRHRLEHQDRHFTQVGKAVALGSDWPRGPLSPMRVIQAALEQLSLKEALRAYSFGSAYASYDEQRKGTLEPGMLADIVVLTANIFEMEPALLNTVKAAHTIFDGRLVYSLERRTTVP